MPGAFVNTNPLMRGLGAMGAPLNLMPAGASMQPGGGSFLDALRAKLGGGAGTPIRNWLGDNRSAMMMFGAGLAGGRTWGEGIAQGLAGATQGRGEDEKRRRRMAATQAIAEAQRAGKLTPELAALISTADDPASAAFQYLTREQEGGSEPKRYEVGNSLVDAEGNVVYQAEEPAPTPTDDIREYNFAKQNGYTGDFPTWMMDQRRAGATNVSVGPDGKMGTVPPGTVAIPDPSQPSGYRIVPMGDSEEERKARAAEAAQQGRQDSTQRSANVVSAKLEQLRQLVTDAPFYNPAVGFGAEWAAGNVGGSNAANARALIDTVEANIAFDRLAQMRQESPTGGALGSITERELSLLGATLASLKQAQSPEQFLQAVDELEILYADIKRKADAYPNAAQYGFGDEGGAAGAGGADLIWDGEKLVPAR